MNTIVAWGAAVGGAAVGMWVVLSGNFNHAKLGINPDKDAASYWAAMAVNGGIVLASAAAAGFGVKAMGGPAPKVG